MAKAPLNDIVVLLPGITGSVLAKGDNELWALSAAALWRSLRTFGQALQDLRLVDDDPDADVLPDGIRATRLIDLPHLIPGLTKSFGYRGIRRFFADNFKVVPGMGEAGPPANYIEFPYDWRRGNANAAVRLQRLLKRRLPQWREFTGRADAKVILIGHSMGGLIARHYLEVLDGWEECRALVTFGTPHRGSLDAAAYLANGYKKLLLDLTDVMRSCTSVYELLPIYECIREGEKFRRVAELADFPSIDATRARAGLAFHRRIEQAVGEHMTDARYREQGYANVPYVGIHQPTTQSAEIAGGRLIMSRSMPPEFAMLEGDGDGTVPWGAAIPLEQSESLFSAFVPERHGALHLVASVHDDLRGRIRQSQVSARLAALRGSLAEPDVALQQPAVEVDLDDVYAAGEPVRVTARVLNTDVPTKVLEATVSPLDPRLPAQVRTFRSDDGGQDGGTWTLLLDELPTGAYTIEVRTSSRAPGTPPPVHDLFLVAGDASSGSST